MKLQHVAFPETIAKYRHREIDEIAQWARDLQLPTPIHVEIGSNRGRFLLELAKEQPDCTVLGIEIRRKFAESLRIEIGEQGLTNTFILGADAMIALPLLFSDGALDAVYLLFPDPWWKKRHSKRRLFTKAFLDLVADKLRVGGHLIVKTDVEPYARFIERTLETIDRFDIVEPSTEIPLLDRLPTTSRERKVQRGDGTIWHYVLRHNDQPRSAHPVDEIDMERFPKPESDGDTNFVARRPRHRS